jgi:hypothetical protein
MITATLTAIVVVFLSYSKKIRGWLPWFLVVLPWSPIVLHCIVVKSQSVGKSMESPKTIHTATSSNKITILVILIMQRFWRTYAFLTVLILKNSSWGEGGGVTADTRSLFLEGIISCQADFGSNF